MNVDSNKPLISVIIPAYNAEETIVRACNSILTQSYDNVELVVVNDGSKDATAQIIDSIAQTDARVKCIHQHNQGVCKARNVGMDCATGDYVFFLDADDALAECCLKKMLSIAQENDADVITGCFKHIEPDGKKYDVLFPLDADLCVWENKTSLAYALKDHPATHSACAKLYRKDKFSDIRFVEGKHIHEDGFYVFEVCKKLPKMIVINDVVVLRYMKKVGAINREWKDSFLDILYFAKRKYSEVELEFPEFIPLARNILVKAGLALINSLRLIDDPRATAAEKESVSIIRKNAGFFIPAVKRDWLRFAFAYMGIYKIYKMIYRAKYNS